MKRVVLIAAVLGAASPALAGPAPLSLEAAQAEARDHAPGLPGYAELDDRVARDPRVRAAAAEVDAARESA